MILVLIESFKFPTQGWGITHNDNYLIISDGSSKLYFLDPENLTITKTLDVKTYQGKSLRNLNELEYVDGKIYSNIWQSNKIVIIDPNTGYIENWVDLSKLQKMIPRKQKIDVLNGIAYNPESKTFYVTGKLWPKLFELKLLKSEK